jgi:hypothetical protein
LIEFFKWIVVYIHPHLETQSKKGKKKKEKRKGEFGGHLNRKLRNQ